jgi:Cytochrome c7 and related cytochrome c
MKKLLMLVIVFLACWILAGFSQQSDLIFSHKFHLQEAEAQCTDCHQAVYTSQSPQDNLLPSMQTCYNCHDEKNTDCKVCHTNPDAARDVPRIVQFREEFAHQVHLESGLDCKVCHAGIELQESPAGAVQIPAESKCRECHGKADYNEGHPLKPANHRVGWSKDHGPTAQLNKEACVVCHQNSYCTDCHEGDNLDRLTHPLNYKNNHGIDAKTNKDNCLTCHQEGVFCIECHQREMVMPRNHAYANWSNPRTGGLHKRQAAGDLDYCLSCHNDAYARNVCIECHQHGVED